jgi:hypothetical protein
MKINDAVKSIMAILKLDPLLYCTEIIAKVEGIAGWLNS